MIVKRKRIFSLITVIITVLSLFFLLITLNNKIQGEHLQNLSNSHINISSNSYNTTYEEILTLDNTVSELETLSNPLGPQIFILEDDLTSIIKVIEVSGSTFEILHNIPLDHNVSHLKIADINNDSEIDFSCIDNMATPSRIQTHFYNTSYYGYNKSEFNQIDTGSTIPMEAYSFSNFFQTNQYDIICTWESDLYGYNWNGSDQNFNEFDSLSLFTPFPLTTEMVFSEDVNDNLGKELIVYGYDSSFNYFYIVEKNLTSNTFNLSKRTIQLPESSIYDDLEFIDVNNDGLKDIIAINNSGMFFYFQNSTGYFQNIFDDLIPQDGFFRIEKAHLDANDLIDFVIANESCLKIYHDNPFINNTEILFPHETSTGSFAIKDFGINDFNNDTYNDVVFVLDNGSYSKILISYQIYDPEDNIPEIKEIDDFFIGSISSGSLAGISVGTGLLSPPPNPMEYSKLPTPKSGSGTDAGGDPTKLAGSSSRKNLDIGVKKPGKWYKRKKFKMYLSSVLIGACLSVLFLFLLYPIALTSTWLVTFGSIVGPIGFFYGFYDFIYVGLYTNKGNLWNAYYKGKTSFFWDVFSWAKPVMTIWCLYATFKMILTLTFTNLIFSFLALGILFGGMIGLLLYSIYGLKINQLIEVEDLRKKSLEHIKQKEKESQ
ncbi:MAG: hypothetical protein GF329_15715 [Candidatus Lokiarchaeota archaeon]|nr:hypothetical protein [Candidatus Lokiarchaeota archaeon]